MTNSPNCTTLLATMAAANCLGEKAPGGVDGRIYVGFRSDIASATFGTNGEILTLVLKDGAVLYKFTGKPEKHDIKWTTVVQEPRNLFTHTGDLFFYPYTQAEFAAVEKLALAERMFVIYETRDGRVRAIGIDVDPYNASLDSGFGLKGQLEGGEGAVFTAPKEQKATLTGTFFNGPKYYKPAATLATSIAELDALCIPEEG